MKRYFPLLIFESITRMEFMEGMGMLNYGGIGRVKNIFFNFGPGDNFIFWMTFWFCWIEDEYKTKSCWYWNFSALGSLYLVILFSVRCETMRGKRLKMANFKRPELEGFISRLACISSSNCSLRFEAPHLFTSPYQNSFFFCF